MWLFILVDRSPHTKYLGVFIDQSLTWQENTEYVLQRSIEESTLATSRLNKGIVHIAFNFKEL